MFIDPRPIQRGRRSNHNRLTTSACPQDVIFGSEGTVQADFERMEEINHEIGLTQMLRGSSPQGAGSDVGDMEKEKIGEHAEDSH